MKKPNMLVYFTWIEHVPWIKNLLNLVPLLWSYSIFQNPQLSFNNLTRVVLQAHYPLASLRNSSSYLKKSSYLSTCHQLSFFNRCIDCWNVLPESFRQLTSTMHFKQRIKLIIMSPNILERQCLWICFVSSMLCLCIVNILHNKI